MSWAKIDDQFSEHPKVIEAGPLAGWLYVRGLCYAAKYLTDGFISDAQAQQLALFAGSSPELLQKLVDCSLWERVNGGYQIHDYLDYNPTAASVRAEREAAKTRMQNKRGKKDVFAGSSPEHSQNFAGSSASPYPYPYPSPKEDEGEVAHAGPAWQAFTKARGTNLTASDSQYIAEFVTLYGDMETAQAIVYCDKTKRDNFLRMNYIQTILSSWQAEGTLGLHTPEYEASKAVKRGNGRRAEPESNQDKLARVYAAMDAKKVDIWQQS